MIGGRSPFAEAGTVGVAGGKIPQPAASGVVAPPGSIARRGRRRVCGRWGLRQLQHWRVLRGQNHTVSVSCSTSNSPGKLRRRVRRGRLAAKGPSPYSTRPHLFRSSLPLSVHTTGARGPLDCFPCPPSSSLPPSCLRAFSTGGGCSRPLAGPGTSRPHLPIGALGRLEKVVRHFYLRATIAMLGYDFHSVVGSIGTLLRT